MINDLTHGQARSVWTKPLQQSPSMKKNIVSEIKQLAILLAIVVFVRSSILGLYIIPTGSMLPSIKLDDRLIANNLAYGLMLPLMEKQIINWASPSRGDIVLFHSPMDDHTLVKRVMGIGGDRLRFRNGVLEINGKLVEEEELKDRDILADMGEPADDKILYMERGYGGPEHYMLRSAVGDRTFFESREWVVPEGKVFCLGDNRDGSADSRVWGFIDVDKLYGKALFVFYSTIPHDGILPKFRSGRAFTPLK